MRKIFTLLALYFITVQVVTAQTVTRDEIRNFSELAAYEAAHPELFKPCPTCPKKEADDGLNAKPAAVMPFPPGANIKMSAPLPKKSSPAFDIPVPMAPSRAPVQNWLGHVDVGSIIPPDTYGAVGLNHVVTATNNFIKIHAKVGGAQISQVTLSSFTGVGSTCDPQMFFDPDTQRWIFAAIGCAGVNNPVIVMTSNTSDPTGTWRTITFVPLAGGLLDHPYLGYDDTKIVIGGRKFAGGTTFTGPDLYLINKADMLSGVPIVFATNAQSIVMSAVEGDSPRPVTVYFPPFSNSGNPTPGTVYIVQSWNNTSLRLTTVTGNIPTAVWNTGAAVFPTAPAPEAWTSGGMGDPGSVEQAPPETRRLEANDARVSSAVMMNGKIWCVQHCAFPVGATGVSVTHTDVQYWQLEGTAGGTFGNVLQRGRTGAVAGQHRWFGSIAVNKQEDVIVGYSMSNNTTELPSAAYSTRQATTPVNTLDDPLSFHNGESRYWKDFSSGRARWGDYSQSHLDPVDNSLWTTQQYAAPGAGAIPPDNNSRWGTWWAQVPASVILASPTVTIDQAAAQPDPTVTSPINFTVVFDQVVTGFATGDVTITGTAGATTGTVTGSGTTYNVAVSGMTGSGTVIVNIPAGVCINGTSDPNLASTSTDNTVTFNLAVPCTITCPANITVGNDPNQCGAVVNYPAPTTIGTCGTVTSVPASGSFFPLGTTTVTATASAGPTCTFTITVNDVQPPTITCPANITVSNDPNQCGAVVNFTTTASDNCPGVTVSSVPASGSFFPVGTTTVTSTATDAAGNTATCTFTITVNDTQPPTITCPANITVSNDPNQCGAVVNYPAPTVSDNCPGVTVSSVPASGSFFPRGTTTVTATATDASGNTATCTFTITVNDTQAPTITCPANINVNATAGLCSAVVNYTTPTASDNCPGVTVALISGLASGSAFPVGTTTVTYRATDAAGNTATCSFTVTVNDTQPPTITCPANITTNNTPGLCSAVVTYPLPTATDNCCLPGAVSLTQTASQTPTAGSVACNAGGFHTNNSYWRAYNLASICLAGPLTINSVQFGIELADANGTGTTQPVTVRVYTSAGAFPGGVRTLVATQVVNVPDQTLSVFNAVLTTPPTIPANSILVLELFTPDGRAPANNRFFIGSNTSAQTGPSYISAADCGIATPTDLAAIGFPNMHIILNANGTTSGPNPITQIAGLASGSVFPVGVTTNTFRATDAAGNTSTCSFTVTVVDNQAPTITCPANIVATTPIGLCTAIVTYTVTATDNCPGVTTALVSGLASGSAFPIGVSTVTWRATDAAGNISTCSFTVTVLDGQLPVISGQPTNKTGCVNDNVVFSVTSSNAVSYQWQQWNGTAWVNITGATGASLTLNSVTLNMNTNSYRVNVIGLCTTITSAFATLYVNDLPTISLVASQSPLLIPGQSMSLTAAVSPTGGSIRWFKNGVLMSGVTSFTLSGLTVDDIGTYRAIYTDPNGCVKTSADLTIGAQTTDKLWVYPNPNSGQFQVRFYNQANETITMVIYDSKGARVYPKDLNNPKIVTTIPYTRIDVDLGKNSSGTYIVVIYDSQGRQIGGRQVVIQH